MKLEPVMEGAGVDTGADLAVADGPTPEQRRLRRLDVCAGLVALAASGAFLGNVLFLQERPAGAPLPEARPAGAVQALDRAKTSRTTVPLPPHAPGSSGAPTTSGAADGALGYLSIRTTVTGTAVPLVPVTATPGRGSADTGRASADARSEPPPRRPPAGLAAAVPDATGAVRPPADVPGSARMLAVQKALAKLGYGPLKVDGRPGGETRTAIQRFQRDRNLPADGEISDRLVRELGAVSGVAVN